VSVARSSLAWVLAAALVAGVALRVWILSGPLAALESDEAISGLMALRMLDGEFAAMYWLSPYGGTIESVVAAIPLAVFGTSVLTLKLATLAVYVAGGVLTWFVGVRTVGRRAAAVGAALMWVWPAYFVWWTTKARAYYGAGFLLGTAALLLVLRLRERDSIRDAALLGLVLGLGWWTTPGIVVLGAPALAWLAWRRPRAYRLAPWALPGALVGAAPWLAWNARNGWLSLDLSPVAAEGSTASGRLDGFFSTVLPTWLGVRVPFSADWLLGPVVGWAVVACALAGLVLAAALRRPAPEPLVTAAVAFPLLAAASQYSYYVAEPRYLVYAAPVPALLLGRAFRGALPAALLLTAATALSVVALGRMEDAGRFHPLAQDVRVPADLTPVLDVLEREGETRVLANYWIAYRLTFEAAERIIATSTGFVRYEPYDRLVRASPAPARVYVARSSVEQRARANLVDRGFRRIRAGGFVVYLR
jgi:hypothetical protein